MTTIENYKKTRKENMEALKIAYKKLVEGDLNIWKQEMKTLFEQFPELTTLTWKQGFFYNDESHNFGIIDFQINGMEIQESGSYFSIDTRRQASEERRISLEGSDDIRLKEASQAIVQLLSVMFKSFGNRHFADTFGKKVAITFNREGLLIEDYEDYETMSEGTLDDLF